MSEQTREGRIESAADERLVDRRTMLRRAAATAAGLIGALALPTAAMAATDDPALAGRESTASAGDPGLWGSNQNDSGDGVGVKGESKTGDGMVAESQAADKSGLWAKNVAAGGAGVTADGNIAGVVGRTTTGHGLWGWSTAAGKAGAYGYNAEATGQGVFGQSTKGIGVLAQSNTGTALKVVGKTTFSRTGIAYVSKGKSSVTIKVNGGATAYTRYLVTLQGSPGAGVYVAYAKTTGTGTFTVTLNKKATRKAAVAWIALD